MLKVLSDIFIAMDQGSIGLLGLRSTRSTMKFLQLRLETSFGIFGTALAWSRLFPSGRTQQVVFNGGQSLNNTVSNGVPSG